MAASTPISLDRCSRCFTTGGKGHHFDEYGLTYFETWCSCDTGRRKQAQYPIDRQAKIEEGAVACEKCCGQGGSGDRWYINETESAYVNWCDCQYGREAKAQAQIIIDETDRRHRLERAERYLLECGIPVRYETAELMDFGPESMAALAEVRQWLASPKQGKGLIVWGAVGSGKTHLGAAVLHEMIRLPRRSFFMAVPNLLDEIRASYNGNRRSREDDDDLLKLACTVDVLLMDDIDAERVTEWVAEKLFAIVNARYNEMLTTLVTTNLSPEALARCIGDRTVSRLVGMCRVVRLQGNDRRVKGQ